MKDKNDTFIEVFDKQRKDFNKIKEDIEKSINESEIDIRYTSQNTLQNSIYRKIQPIIKGLWFKANLLERYIHWQVKTEEYIREIQNKTLLERFIQISSPSGDKSLWILLMGDRPWSFTNWGYASHIEDNREKIFQNHYDDYYFLSEVNNENTANQIVTEHVKKGYFKKLNRFHIEIKSILSSPSLIQSAKDVIDTIQMNNLIIKRDEILNLAGEQIKTNNQNGLVIGSFLLRYVLEDNFKNHYRQLLEGKFKHTLGKLINYLVQIGKILEDDKEPLLNINDNLNKVIHPQGDNVEIPLSEDILALIPEIEKYLKKYGDNI